MCDSNVTQEQWHKKQAVDNFNGTWDLIDKVDRTPEEQLKMIHMAHASRYHWGEIGTELEFARGEWQVARVYALVGHGHSALYHAQASLDYCKKANIGDFDLAFAYEAIARAYHVLRNHKDSIHYVKLAKEAAETIAKEENKQYVLAEIATIK